MQYNYSKPYDEEILERLHGVQLQILGDLDRVCRKYGIKYFALYGTAIGAVRHGGFIPWDDDIDVGMLREDYDKFIHIKIRIIPAPLHTFKRRGLNLYHNFPEEQSII